MKFHNCHHTTLGVLFWIHGGALMSGSGRFDEYGPHYFMEQGDLVIVTINYRVGPLGINKSRGLYY